MLRNGKYELIRKTNEKTHTIYSSDMKSKIIIDKPSSSKNDVMRFKNEESGDKLFYFAARNTDVEPGKIEATKRGNKITAVFTAGSSKSDNGKIDLVAYQLASEGFTIVDEIHGHPDSAGNQTFVPSGHYGYEKGNSGSLNPIPNIRDKDAGAAKNWQNPNNPYYDKLKNATHRVYAPKYNTITTYDGINKATVIKYPENKQVYND